MCFHGPRLVHSLASSGSGIPGRLPGRREEIFKRIALAWDCLGDRDKRKMYDAELARGGGQAVRTPGQPQCRAGIVVESARPGIVHLQERETRSLREEVMAA